jgi:hypothetical protein
MQCKQSWATGRLCNRLPYLALLHITPLNRRLYCVQEFLWIDLFCATSVATALHIPVERMQAARSAAKQAQDGTVAVVDPACSVLSRSWFL